MSTNNRPEGSGKASHPLDNYTVQPQQESKEQSPYYHSAAPSISLPKGGGALKGIDEKFSVNAVNGTAGLQIPLPLSPGRSGFTPSLALSYNSGSGNSPFGLGWGLGLPAIQRKTDKRLPLYDDANDSDIFLLAGAEDLIPKLDENGDPDDDNLTADGKTYLVRRYIPRIEGLFARIEYIKPLVGSGSWWRVTTIDNITTWYGLTANSRLAAPNDPERIFKWMPELVTDGKGNVQQYIYKPENLDGVPVLVHERNRYNGQARFTNLYLKRVRYCNLTAFQYTTNPFQPDVPTTAEDFMMDVVMDYGEHDGATTSDIPVFTPIGSHTWDCRTDPFSDFHAGFEIRTYRRCRRVLMFHRFKELNTDRSYTPVLVRSLDLTYEHGTLTYSSECTEADFITAATQTGYKKVDGTWQIKSLPSMTMDYQPLEWDNTLHTVSPDDVQNVPQGLTGSYQWIDLNGEGLPGILSEQGGGWYYKNNLGDGHFTPALQVADKPSFSGLGSELQWQDLDADGRRQLVSRSAEHPGYFEVDELTAPTTIQDKLEWKAFRTFKDNANVDWNSPYTKMLDLDGDGRPDLLLTEDRAWTWYKNEGTAGITVGGQVSAPGPDEELGPRLLLNDNIQRIFLADMNGDGMTDLVRITNGEVCYWPNLGWGKFGAKVTMSNAPRFAAPDLYNPLYLQLADISGTGAPDLIYIGNGSCTVWINLAGNAFGEGVEIATLPSVEPYSKIAILDFLGNGTGCIVWSSPLPQHANAPLRYIDLMGGIKPLLMTDYRNGMGKKVHVNYKSSTKYYLEDKLAGKAWATKLPFPVQCIESIITTDEVSATTYTQSYSYHHGYYDHEEREFRGFGRVETVDIDHASIDGGQSLDQDPVLTKTWYHTGAWMKEQTLLDAFAAEYYHFSGWNDLPVQATFPAELSSQQQREAYRALKGSPLRQEVYALDSSDKEDKPYTVTITAYQVKVVQSLPLPSTSGGASFRVEQTQSLAWSCERDPEDARLAQSLTLETDDWGNVLLSAEVVYPRFGGPRISYSTIAGLFTGVDVTDDVALATALNSYFDEESLKNGNVVRDGLVELGILSNSYVLNSTIPAGTMPKWIPFPVALAQTRMHITCSEQAYTNDAIDLTYHVYYRLRIPYEAKSYELTGYTQPTTLWTVDGLKSVIGGAAEINYAVAPGAGVEKRVLSHSRTSFLPDNTDTPPLAWGAIESLAIPYQQYTLAFTDDIRAAAYDTRVTDFMLDKGGYISPETDARWWVPSGTVQYSASPASDFYTPVSFTDPWENVTTIEYWPDYKLLPLSVTDAKGNENKVIHYDWRCMQPTSMEDANENKSEIIYDALCMPVAVAVKGKGTEADYLNPLIIPVTPADPALNADTVDDLAFQSDFWSATTATDLETAAKNLLGRATWRTIYNLQSSPAAVAMIGREEHYKNNANSDVVIRISYTDGLGRIIMHKARAADAPGGIARWIGTGRTVYNNKGKPVMQYEPYFSSTHACDTAAQAVASGISPRIHYDPLGRALRTSMPDGTFSKVEWDSWMQKSYDPNDTVLQSDWYALRTGSGALATIAEEADAAAKAAKHADTPVVVHLDTLARPFYTIQHNRTPPSSGTTWVDEYLHSYEILDITGNRRAVHDAQGLIPLTYKYNMLKAPCYQNSIDGGDGRMLSDVAGQPLYHWDADNRRFRTKYDALRRPLKTKVTYGSSTITLSIINYGEDLADDKAKNLRGKMVSSYDGAGKHFVSAYDFKGMPLASNQRLLSDATIADADWNTLTDSDLNTEIFIATAITDALGRPISTTETNDNAGVADYIYVTEYTYEKDGALKTVDVNGDNYVQDIHHNAKGQREAIWYSNGTKTSYTYDALNYRLTRLLTVNLNTNNKLQDFTHYYDAVGNITRIVDAAQDTIFFDNSKIDTGKDYTYDALYRLVKATGRESVTAPDFSSDNTKDGQPFVNALVKWDGGAFRNYTQKYTYDKAGNMLQFQHIAGTGSYTRNFSVSTTSNRLNSTTVSSTYNYTHDNRGNIISMPHLAGMQYDSLNQMNHVRAGSEDAYYQYSGGQRIRKYVDKGSGLAEERIYLGSFEIFRRYDSGTIKGERTTVHVSDGAGRIAMLEVNTGDSDDYEDSLKRFIYSNHLGSSGLELDEGAAIISYEEYHPFGTTAYQAMNSTINAVAKRYRYTGKERDEESGLNYHGARYYAPWLCRWCAVDPLESKYAGLSPYNYCENNPINLHDPTGKGSHDPKNNNSQPANSPSSVFHPLTLSDIKRLSTGGVPTSTEPTPPSVTQARIAPQIAKAQKKMAEKKMVANTPYSVMDVAGHIHMGTIATKANVDHEAKRIEVQHDEQIAQAITGGLGGSIGYLAGGEKGAMLGASIDGVLMSFAGAGTPFGKTQSVERDPMTVNGFQTEQVPTEPFVPKRDVSEEPLKPTTFEGLNERSDKTSSHEPYSYKLTERNSQGNFELEATNSQQIVGILAEISVINDGKTLILSDVLMGGVNSAGKELEGGDFGIKAIYNLLKENASWFKERGYEEIIVDYHRAGYSSSKVKFVQKQIKIDLKKY